MDHDPPLDYSVILEHLDDWRKAGKVAAEAMMFGKKLIKPGVRAIDVVEQIEQKMRDLGAAPAFPTILACDHIAAHWAPDPDDPLILENQLIKLDMGAGVNGAIGDNACTVDLSGKWTDLVKASRAAVDNLAKEIHVGMELRKAGRIIQETIESFGYKPIRNLSGHGIMPFTIHTWPSVPNFDNGDKTKIIPGMVLASEPFATDGQGMVTEAEECNIFGFIKRRPVRSPITRSVIPDIEAFQGMPFTTRWLAKKHPLVKLNFALRELVESGMIRAYPPLVEVGKGMVSQHERSFFVGEDKVEVLTPWDY